ncbi:hypothetical protein ACA910_008322 [Epithemia clementina (nom. ined.)]
MVFRNKLLEACCIWIAAIVSAQARIFNDQQVEFFQREGYIKVSGLMDESFVGGLAEAATYTIKTSPKFHFYFSVSQSGILFGSTAAKDKHQNETATVSAQAFRQAALYSQFPQAVAELLKLDPGKHNLRVLRDVFMAKSVEDPESCDWHVDDLGLWPQSFLPAAEGIDGVNVWIALDDMPAAFQGSMALSSRSHTASWRHRAYLALGQNRSQDGGRSKEDVIRKILDHRQKNSSSSANKDKKPQKAKYPTCDIRITDPEVTEKLDAAQVVLDLKRGDVIFATRRLFHRTMPVTEAGLEFYRKQGQEHLSRYSIRYVPGSAKLPQGWSVEWSILEDAANAGRSLDAVVEHGEKMFYPQVWPAFDTSFEPRLKGMEVALPSLAQRAQEEYMATIFGATAEQQVSPSK